MFFRPYHYGTFGINNMVRRFKRPVGKKKKKNERRWRHGAFLWCEQSLRNREVTYTMWIR